MAATTFVIRKNDRLPELAATLKDATDAAVNLTGATIAFHMRSKNGGPAKINATATVVDATAGKVKYSWASGDTDTAGQFLGEFEVTWPDGRTETFPNLQYVPVLVTDEVG